MTNRLPLMAFACLVVLGSGSRLVAQSVDFGATPALNFPGQAPDGKIYFYGKATYATGGFPSISATIYPEGGGNVLSIDPPSVKLRDLSPGQSEASFGTAANPISTPSALTPNKSYWLWLTLTLTQGTSTSYIYSAWYKVTVTAGSGTAPGAAAATITLAPKANNGAGRIVADVTINLPSAYHPVNNPSGWSNNARPRLIAIPMNGPLTGPGQGPPEQTVVLNPVPGNPNRWTARFNYDEIGTGSYSLLCIHPVRQGAFGNTVLVGSALSSNYNVP